MLVHLIIAFNLGLFSTLHCIGMCGGIISTMMLASSDKSSDANLNKINLSFAYNLGRIASYSLAGLISGFLGAQIVGAVSNLNLHFILQIFAAAVLIGIALNMLGVFPFNRLIESIGMKLWKYIQPLGKNLLPVNTIGRALLFGMLWGWLPCGMVYSALLLSLSVGTALDGMLVMFFFGLGTLPGMVSAGYFSSKLSQLKEKKSLRIVTAVLLIMIAISLPVSTWYFSKHHDHSASSGSGHEHHHHMH